MKETLKNKTIFMTGATSGLGRVAAIELAAKGAKLIVLARDLSKGEALKEAYAKKDPEGSGQIEIIEGDLNSFESIKIACQLIKSKYPKLDQLVLNAGIMNSKFRKSADGIEETLQVNLLAPLLFTYLLVDLLAEDGGSKIIITSSGLHQGEINFKDIEFEKKYVGFQAYRQSKLGVILVTKWLANYLKSKNIGVYCQHPGMVRTNLGRDAGWFSRMIFWMLGTSPEKGAETLVFLVESPNQNLESGAYYSNKVVTKTTSQSYDLGVAEKLLEVSREYVQEYLEESNPFF